MFAIYIKRAAEAFGITHTREIYEKAIEVLPNDGARYVVGVMYSAGDLLPIQLTTVTPPLPSPPLSYTSAEKCVSVMLNLRQN